jgi:hypothetical protein
MYWGCVVALFNEFHLLIKKKKEKIKNKKKKKKRNHKSNLRHLETIVIY